MIEKVFEILGITSYTINQEYIVTIFCLMLLFFGVIVVFNALLSMITGLLKIE